MMTDRSYRIHLVSYAPIVTAQDLALPIDRVIDGLLALDPVTFSLLGLSPALNEHPVRLGADNRLGAFLAKSEIDYGFGRMPDEPTHELTLFNSDRRERDVCLVISFSPGSLSQAPTVVTLRLGAEAAMPPPSAAALPAEGLLGRRGAYLNGLFTLLSGAFRGRHGYISLPGQPASERFPQRFEAGWLTRVTAAAAAPPAQPEWLLQLDADELKVFASRQLAEEIFDDLAPSIGAVRDALDAAQASAASGARVALPATLSADMPAALLEALSPNAPVGTVALELPGPRGPALPFTPPKGLMPGPPAAGGSAASSGEDGVAEADEDSEEAAAETRRLSSEELARVGSGTVVFALPESSEADEAAD